MGLYDDGSAGSFPGLRRKITRASFRTVPAENRIKIPNNEGYRSLEKMFQGPVRNTCRTRSLADVETRDSFLNLVRVG
jgi:hypothetical protein